MRIESREFKQDDGTIKKSVIIICETDEESKILDIIGEPKECGNYKHDVRGELRLADGCGEFYVSLESDPHRYYKDDLDFLGELSDKDCDGDCYETRPDHSDCPTCRARHYINEAGGVIHEGAHEIRRELKNEDS